MQKTSEILTRGSTIRAELVNGQVLYAWVHDLDVIGIWVKRGRGDHTLFPWSQIACLYRVPREEVKNALATVADAFTPVTPINPAWAANYDGEDQ